MSELVSIIIPTYNRPQVISRAVDSALAQMGEVEVIIVNDGGNIEALEEALDKYSTIRTYHLPTNLGVSVARNYGIEQSKGAMLLFLDDDDELEPSFIKSALQQFDSNTEVLIGDSELVGNSVDKHFKKVYAYNQYLSDQYQHEPTDHWGYFLQYMPPIFAMLFRRTLFDDYQFNESLNYGEDRELLLRLKHRCTMIKAPLLAGKYHFHSTQSQAPLDKFIEAVSPLVDSRHAKAYVQLLSAYYWWKKGHFLKVGTAMVKSLKSPYVVVKQFVLFLRLIMLR